LLPRKVDNEIVSRFVAAVLLLVGALTPAGLLMADDWPEWRGTGRDGVWRETGIVEQFPKEGLTVRWRTPLGSGYAGPSVASGRVFVTAFRPTGGTKGQESLLALDQATGERLWSHSWTVDYAGIDYASGPRATPTVDSERVYALGAAGDLVCLQAETGNELWRRSFARDLGAELPAWGMTSAPLIYDDLVIAIAAGRPNAKVVAFDKLSGAERWRALSSEDSGPGYSQPILVEVDETPTLIVWHAGALVALKPDNGEVLWRQEFRIRMETPIATPVWSRPHLLVSAFFNGSRLYRVGAAGAQMVWKGSSDSETFSDGLHALMNSPVINGDYIYGICSLGQLRCLRLSTGERVWETQAVTREKARNASAFVVRNGDRYFINNDRGELIIARFGPFGYEEVSRTDLIRPTSKSGGRRELGAVNWSHPAYAGRHIFARNDEEIICVSLEAE